MHPVKRINSKVYANAMNQNEEKALNLLQTRVRQLILQHEELRREVKRLTAEIHERQTETELLKEECERLRHNYNTLKDARLVAVASGDTKEAERRLGKLIREIDKCIALLNV